MMTSIYDFSAKTNTGDTLALSEFKGRVLLIVNTASQCGFTPQYEGLQLLHEKLADKGLVVLGFPCNQFGNQEPGSAEEISEFCSLNFNVSFPIMEKIEVNGENAHPLYQYLKDQARGLLGSKSVKWNFTKFLVNRQGEVINRYSAVDKPEKIAADIEALL